jgi:hypothetical protein
LEFFLIIANYILSERFINIKKEPMQTEIQKGQSVLRPRARLIRTIGDELISNDIVAILELVKNSYDADASIIVISIEGRVVEVEEGRKKKRILVKNGGSIKIYDDGIGMTLMTVKEAWMEPATIIKKNKENTPDKGRRYTGEKGIGRFAAAKLAKTLKMVTKVKIDNEVVATFNWADFSMDEKYLDQVECSWEVRKPEEIKEQGTSLYLNELNADWDEEKIRLLRITLSRLINPLSPIPDFLMQLVLPNEMEDLAGDIEPPSSLTTPMYSIEGKVDDKGIATLEYKSINISKPENIKIDISKEVRPIREIITGPFSFLFYVWDRDTESLKDFIKSTGSTVKNLREDLNALSGVSIYRDNFRVLPYGEPKNDWLRLDLRRVQNPTMRISNNQIIGFISTSLSNNPEFKDQSNREGLVDSQSFTDLQDSIKVILNQLEERRYKERRKEGEGKEKLSLFANFNISNYLQVITKKHPTDKDVIDAVEKTEVSIKEGILRVQEVLSRYRRLSTLGLLIDSVLHDGNSYLGFIDGELLLIEKGIKKNGKSEEVFQHIKNAREQKGLLAQLFKRLEPFGGRKRGRPKLLILEKSIENVFYLHKSQLEKLKIQYSLPDTQTQVKIDEGELQYIFINLLQNSMYWLEQITESRKIIVLVERTEEAVSILFSDNGPGIKEENYEAIFDPYFSTKSDGIGLGLTIVGEIVTEYNGELYLVENGPLDGATFKIIFKRRT